MGSKGRIVRIRLVNIAASYGGRPETGRDNRAEFQAATAC